MQGLQAGWTQRRRPLRSVVRGDGFDVRGKTEWRRALRIAAGVGGGWPAASRSRAWLRRRR
jgi:hypothetical protein